MDGARRQRDSRKGEGDREQTLVIYGLKITCVCICVYV